MYSRTFSQFNRRSNRITSALRTGTVRPTREIIRELAELSIKLEDAPVKPVVIARLTAFRKNGHRTLVEIHADSTFTSFYHFSIQQGNRRSTRQSLRCGSRNEGSFLGLAGLDAIAERLSHYSAKFNPVVQIKIQIFRKRLYRRMLSISPDQLGLRKSVMCMPSGSLDEDKGGRAQ